MTVDSDHYGLLRTHYRTNYLRILAIGSVIVRNVLPYALRGFVLFLYSHVFAGLRWDCTRKIKENASFGKKMKLAGEVIVDIREQPLRINPICKIRISWHLHYHYLAKLTSSSNLPRYYYSNLTKTDLISVIRASNKPL